MVSSSLADEFPFKFPVLLVETMIGSLLLGFAILWADLLDEVVFFIEGAVLLLIAVIFELAFGARESIAPLHASVRDQVHVNNKEEKPEFNHTNNSRTQIIIDKRTSRNVTKSFSISAILLWLFAGTQSTDIAVVRQASQFSFVVVVLFLPFGASLGLLHSMRNPRVSVSRVFDAYINLGMLLIGIPMMVFLFFVVGAVVVLTFVPPGEDPGRILLITMFVAVLVIAIIQVGYIFSTIQKSAKYHGLTISGYISLKLSKEEKIRQKKEKRARAEQADRLYTQIDDLKKKVRPWAVSSTVPVSTIDMSQYEYASSENPFRTLIRELGPPLLGIFFGNIVMIALLLILSSMVTH